MKISNTHVLIVVVTLIAGAIYFISSQSAEVGGGEAVDVAARPVSLSEKSEDRGDFLSPEEKSTRYELAKEITTPDGFINTDPITMGELVGKKVVLVDFWTYSCINCQRTTPYLNAWHEKYSDKGLVIIGMHTPEFEFEKKYANVLDAVEKFKIKYPVVLDNDYSTWTAYKNRYWPRKYLIDIDGYIVYDHIGEGAYEETEMKIRELLSERTLVLEEGADAGSDNEGLAASSISEIKVSSQSPETYFGASRNELLGNGTRFLQGVENFELPESVLPNTLYLSGLWDIDEEYAESASVAGIFYYYNSGDVYLVAEADSEVEVKVFQDGESVGSSAGVDVDENGVVKIKESGLYKIIHNASPGAHFLELRVGGAGLRVYTFTFG